MAKQSLGRPKIFHGSAECQSGWLKIATRKPSLSNTRPNSAIAKLG